MAVPTAPKYKLEVDADGKAVELPLLRIRGTVEENPHMRAFWGATISFFLAFLGWFALAPLGLEVAHSMSICENQKYPPTEHPTRKAYLKFKHLKTGRLYCRYGKDDDDDPSACNPVPQAIANATGGNSSACVSSGFDAGCLNPYRPELLGKCVCTRGTHCASTLDQGGVASVASTILVRIVIGTFLERYGPVYVQSGLLLCGGSWVAISAFITHPWNYILIRFFIGMLGGTFVTNQFWCSIMFSKNIVGTVNATAAGWGNLGGGATQIFMVVVLLNIFKAQGMGSDSAWRMSMLVPGAFFSVCAGCLLLFCWDLPRQRRYTTTATGKADGASWRDYIEVAKDKRVLIMSFQYSACFGAELAMNNQLATHFRTYFQMKASKASTLAGSFGLMNIFARTLGGVFSDFLFAKVGFRGRVWAQFLALFFEAVLLFSFGFVTNEHGWPLALGVVLAFSLFVQMAEGTSYAIVPFICKEQLAVVSAVVGAGGNMGAVIAGQGFYSPMDDDLLPFKVHAAYVMLAALLTPVFFWQADDDSSKPMASTESTTGLTQKCSDNADSAKETGPQGPPGTSIMNFTSIGSAGKSIVNADSANTGPPGKSIVNLAWDIDLCSRSCSNTDLHIAHKGILNLAWNIDFCSSPRSSGGDSRGAISPTGSPTASLAARHALSLSRQQQGPNKDTTNLTWNIDL